MTTTLQDLKPSQIKPHAKNPRGRDVGDVAELAASIAEKGVLEPLVVAPVTPMTTAVPEYTLILGHRRLAAAKVAKAKTVPCLVRDDLDDPAEQIETMLVENLQRTDLTPIEEAQAYQQLLEFPGYTIKRITTATGRAAATVKSRLALTKLPAKTQIKVQSGQISLADAAVLSEFADDFGAVGRLERAIGTYNWAYTLQRARADRADKKAAAKKTAELTKAGVRVLTSAELTKIQNASADDAAVDGWVFLADVDDSLNITPEKHAACPGHAATVVHGEAEFVCVEPQRHPELVDEDSDGAAPRDDETQAKRKAETARIDAELATAATVRRAYLAEVVNGTSAVSTENLALQLMRDEVMVQANGGAPLQMAAAVLLPNRANDTALVEQVRDRVNRLSLPGLVIVLNLVGDAWSDIALEHEDGWRSPTGSVYGLHRSCAKWVAELTDLYGYEFSQPERDLIPPPAVVDVDLPAGDAVAS
jgi:ParB family transcriptional regulator, chromosome partitioning protein